MGNGNFGHAFDKAREASARVMSLTCKCGNRVFVYQLLVEARIKEYPALLSVENGIGGNPERHLHHRDLMEVYVCSRCGKVVLENKLQDITKDGRTEQEIQAGCALANQSLEEYSQGSKEKQGPV